MMRIREVYKMLLSWGPYLYSDNGNYGELTRAVLDRTWTHVWSTFIGMYEHIFSCIQWHKHTHTDALHISLSAFIVRPLCPYSEHRRVCPLCLPGRTSCRLCTAAIAAATASHSRRRCWCWCRCSSCTCAYLLCFGMFVCVCVCVHLFVCVRTFAANPFILRAWVRCVLDALSSFHSSAFYSTCNGRECRMCMLTCICHIERAYTLFHAIKGLSSIYTLPPCAITTITDSRINWKRSLATPTTSTHTHTYTQRGEI